MALDIYTLSQAKKLDIKWPDLYFTPSYGRVCEVSDGGFWRVACWQDGEILYPFLTKNIEETPYFDITSPYGYSGIYLKEGSTGSSFVEFRNSFKTWAHSQGIISEFIRINRLLDLDVTKIESDTQIDIDQHNKTLLLDIDQEFDDLFANMEGRARTKTRKAQKLGYEATISRALPGVLGSETPFRKLYTATMLRVNATPYYHFSDQYFDAMCAELQDHLYTIEITDQSGNIAMSGLFLVWEPFLHLHLVGSTKQAMHDGVGNLLYTETAAWGCANPKYKHMHIGGGQHDNDALYRFKKGFGGETKEFYLARCILNQDIYESLISTKADGLEVTAEQLKNSKFFPAYRAVL